MLKLLNIIKKKSKKRLKMLIFDPDESIAAVEFVFKFKLYSVITVMDVSFCRGNRMMMKLIRTKMVHV